jgi:asparagine N-glycosylation enzyme membrane subunit Stt3
MTSADIMRFVIIISLGVVSFITFLVAGTIVGLMWVDSFACVTCKKYPVGIYVLAILGLLLLSSIGMEAAEAPGPWQKWVKANWMALVVAALSGIAAGLVMAGD